MDKFYKIISYAIFEYCDKMYNGAHKNKDVEYGMAVFFLLCFKHEKYHSEGIYGSTDDKKY